MMNIFEGSRRVAKLAAAAWIVEFFIAASLLTSPAAAEQIKLTCSGIREATSVFPVGATTTKPMSVFLIFDTDTRTVTVDGYALASTVLDRKHRQNIFIEDDEKFWFVHEYKDDKMSVLSSLKVNRYTGQSEISETILNIGNSMTRFHSKMQCEKLSTKKF